MSESPEKIRAFIAVRIPEAIIAQLLSAQDQLKREFRNVAWTRAEAMHVTLQFLGNVESARLSELTMSLRRATEQIPSFEMELAGLGSFGNRVLWVGVSRGADPLTSLAIAVRRATKSFDIDQEDRPFNPHATLGRFREQQCGVSKVLREMAAPQFGFWTVNDFELIRSELSPKGARHTTAGTFYLR